MVIYFVDTPITFLISVLYTYTCYKGYNDEVWAKFVFPRCRKFGVEISWPSSEKWAVGSMCVDALGKYPRGITSTERKDCKLSHISL